MATKKMYRCVKCKKHYEEGDIIRVEPDPNVQKDEYWCVFCNEKKAWKKRYAKINQGEVPIPPPPRPVSNGMEGIPPELAEQLLEQLRKKQGGKEKDGTNKEE